MRLSMIFLQIWETMTEGAGTVGVSWPRALTMQRYRIRRRISQLRFLDSALLQPVCEVGRRRIVALCDELLGGPVGERCLDFRTSLLLPGPFDRPTGRPEARLARRASFVGPMQRYRRSLGRPPLQPKTIPDLQDLVAARKSVSQGSISGKRAKYSVKRFRRSFCARCAVPWHSGRPFKGMTNRDNPAYLDGPL